MDDASCVRGIEALANLCRDVDHARGFERQLAGEVERRALDELHDQKTNRLGTGTLRIGGFADVMKRADARMVQRRDDARLALEAVARAARSLDTDGDSTLIATVRSRRVSRAR